MRKSASIEIKPKKSDTSISSEYVTELLDEYLVDKKDNSIKNFRVLEYLNKVALIEFDSDYSQRIIQDVLSKNFNHYTRDMKDILFDLGNFHFNYDDDSKIVIDRYEYLRNCSVCDQNAYLYLYDSKGDQVHSECINYHDSKLFDIDEYLMPYHRGFIGSYKVTDHNHKVKLKQDYFKNKISSH